MEESVNDAAGRSLTASAISGGGAGPGVEDLGNGWIEKAEGRGRRQRVRGQRVRGCRESSTW